MKSVFFQSGKKKNRVRTLSAVLLTALLFCTAFSGPARAEPEKLRIVATIFPVYDWVREILGEQAGSTELTMLLDSGADLHNYQPTAPDIMKIKQADLFIYIGGESDEWAEDVLAIAVNPDRIDVNLMEALGEDAREEHGSP